jgi:hypothetical protein
MLSEHERAAIRTAVQEILDDEEQRYVVEAARRAAALEHRGSDPLNLRPVPLRMR